MTLPQAPARGLWSRDRAGAARAHLDVILVAALTAAALILRLTQMVHQSLFGDEIWAYQEIVGHGFRLMVHDVRTGVESSPPLFFAFAWVSVKLGDPTVLIRLPTLVLGTALIPLTYLLGRESVGRLPGTVAAACLALSPFSLYYGVEGRPYATMGFFVVLSTYALLRAVRTGDWRWWALYACAVTGAAYTHYTAIFALAVQGAWSLWACRARLRAPILAHVAVGVLYLPWLQYLHGTALGVYSLLQPLTPVNVLRDLGRVIAGYPYATLRSIPTWPGLALILVLALAGAAWMWRGRVRWPAASALVGALALATPVGLLAYSILATDLWLARGIYASVPYAYLMLGALLMAIPARARVLAAAAVLIVLVAGAIRSLGTIYMRPPYRQMAAYLDRVAGPTTPVAYYTFWSAPDLAVEYHHPHTIWASSAPKNFSAVAPGATTWLVVEPVYLADVHAATPRPRGFDLIAHRHFGGALATEVFVYQPTG